MAKPIFVAQLSFMRSIEEVSAMRSSLVASLPDWHVIVIKDKCASEDRYYGFTDHQQIIEEFIEMKKRLMDQWPKIST